MLYSLLCYVQSLFILLTTVWPFHTNLPPFPTPGGIGCDIKLPWKTECCVGHLAIENKDIARLQEKNLPWSITWFRKSGSVVAQLSTHHTSYIWKTMVVWMTLAYQNLSSTEPSMNRCTLINHKYTCKDLFFWWYPRTEETKTGFSKTEHVHVFSNLHRTSTHLTNS